jgi:hypothetical protein
MLLMQPLQFRLIKSKITAAEDKKSHDLITQCTMNSIFLDLITQCTVNSIFLGPYFIFPNRAVGIVTCYVQEDPRIDFQRVQEFSFCRDQLRGLLYYN